MTGGASGPQPSSTRVLSGRSRSGPAGVLFRAMPPDRDGVKTGFEDVGGLGAVEIAWSLPEVYLAPEASLTFFMMPSTVRSASERAVIWT